jgi:hypothetical protein
MENRRTTYPISIEHKHKEALIINTILRNNGYTPRTQPHTKKFPSNTIQKEPKKWAAFTYTGKEVRAITKLFRDTEIHIAYKTKNIIQHHLQMKNDNDPDKYNHSSIYEMRCKSCNLKYVGQTGRSFRIRYKEHINAIHNKKPTSRYAQHILETGHTYGTIEDTLNILHRNKKGLANEYTRTIPHTQTYQRKPTIK